MEQPAVEIEVFATGTHTSKQGATRVWSKEDLVSHATEFNTRQPKERCPHTIGHPEKDSAPAYGYTEEFAVVDRTDEKGDPMSVLVGKCRDFIPEFVAAVRKGYWRERSLGIKNGRINHIAWLGGMLPAVKSLAPFSFSATDDDTLEEWAESPSTNSTGTTMTPEEITAIGVALADALKPQFESITAAVSGKPAEETEAEEETNLSGGKEDERLTQALAEIATLKAKNLDDSFSTFLDSAEMKGRVKPADRPAILREMKILSQAEDYEFSAADGKTTKRSPLEDYKDRLKARPTAALLQEFAINGDTPDPEATEIQERAKKIATSNGKARR